MPQGFIPPTTKRGYMDANAPGIGRGFNINDFRSHRDHEGILRTHDFHVEIPWPEGLIRTAAFTNIQRNLELTCDTINFPATSLHTYKVHRYSYGALETKPLLPVFSELQCTFLCDQQSQLWQFFHKWMQIAVNYDFDDNPITNGTMAVYEISYKHEYAVDMFLYIYNPLGDLVRKVGFREAYPVSVQDIGLNWGERDRYIKVPVVFTFFDWNEEVVTGQQGQTTSTPTQTPNINAPNIGSGLG
jgi:hypothetical protein